MGGVGFDYRKGFFVLLLFRGVFVGCKLGAYGFNHLEFDALFIPAGMCVLLALSYSIYTSRIRNINS